MADPNDPTQTPPAASQAAPAEQPATAAPVFTAEQVAERERIAAQKAHDAAEAAARRRYDEKLKAASTQPQQQPATQPAAQPVAGGMSAQDFLRISAFTAAATEHGIPARGVEMLLGEFMTAKPTDPRAWVAEQAEQFGWRKPTPTSNPTVANTAPAPQAQNAQPVTGHAAPSNSATVITADTPLINLTEQQRQDWIRQHGWMKYTDRMREEAVRGQTRLRLPR